MLSPIPVNTKSLLFQSVTKTGFLYAGPHHMHPESIVLHNYSIHLPAPICKASKIRVKARQKVIKDTRNKDSGRVASPFQPPLSKMQDNSVNRVIYIINLLMICCILFWYLTENIRQVQGCFQGFVLFSPPSQLDTGYKVLIIL